MILCWIIVSRSWVFFFATALFFFMSVINCYQDYLQYNLGIQALLNYSKTSINTYPLDSCCFDFLWKTHSGVFFFQIALTTMSLLQIKKTKTCNTSLMYQFAVIPTVFHLKNTYPSDSRRRMSTKQRASKFAVHNFSSLKILYISNISNPWIMLGATTLIAYKQLAKTTLGL